MAATNEWNPLFLTQEISGAGNIVIKNHTFMGEAGQGPKNNTFTGAVTIEGGFVYLADVNGLGATSAGTTVLPGGTLAVVDGWHLGDDAVIAEPLTLNGLGVPSWFNGGNPAGALFAWEGHRTFTGPVNLASTSAIITRGTSVLKLTGPLTAADGAGLEKHGDGTLKISGTTLESVTVYGGNLAISSGTAKTKSLAVEAGSIDLTKSSLAVDYTGATVYDDLLSKVTTDLIMTSAGSRYVVGIVDNVSRPEPLTSFGTPSVAVDATTVLLRGTLKGDSDLSGVVDFDDLLGLAQNYGQSALTASQQSLLGEAFLADLALARSLAPEPTLLAAGMAVLAVGRRRRSC